MGASQVVTNTGAKTSRVRIRRRASNSECFLRARCRRAFSLGCARWLRPGWPARQRASASLFHCRPPAGIRSLPDLLAYEFLPDLPDVETPRTPDSVSSRRLGLPSPPANDLVRALTELFVGIGRLLRDVGMSPHADAIDGLPPHAHAPHAHHFRAASLEESALAAHNGLSASQQAPAAPSPGRS
jgi:hypothetical protein